MVLGICLCVGLILKHLIPSEKINKYIPLIVGLLGVFLAMWNAGWKFSPEILLRGLFSGLASAGLYEMFKNSLGDIYNNLKKLISGEKNE